VDAALMIPKLKHLHSKVEASISPENESVLMDLLGEDAWDALQEIGDMLNPTEQSGQDEYGEFWNRLN